MPFIIRAAAPFAVLLLLAVPTAHAASLEKQLLKATKKGNLDAVVVLLEAGADVSAQTKIQKQTSLHIAAHKGHLDIVQTLIEAGADPNAKDRIGRTPLHLAAGRGLIQGVVAGTKSKAKSAACKSAEMAEKGTAVGTTATRVAATWALAASDALCGMGPGTSALVAKKAQGLVMLLLGGGDPNARDNKGRTPLHAAAIKGQLPAVEILIKVGAALDMKDFDGKTPSELAVKKGHLEAMAMLNAAIEAANAES